MNTVFVAGSINMDVVVQVDRRPKPGETLVGNDLDFVLGGKGANQAISAARLGTPVEMIGKVGTDEFGEQLIDRLRTEELSLSNVNRSDRSPTGTAVITVDESSENYIVLIPGCNMDLQAEAVRNVGPGDGDVAVSQFEIPQPVIRAFFEEARNNDSTTILNPSPAAEFDEPILPLVEYLIVNETEAHFFNDQDRSLPLSRTDVVDTCESLRAHDEQVIIVTLGENGVIADSSTETIVLDSHSVDTVDTTAAGDAFVGAFATAISEGKDLDDALEFANAAGAVATTTVGASVSLPERGEVNRMRK